MVEQQKPSPNITPANRPFFEAARQSRLVLPKCRRCGSIFYYPRFACPTCLSMELEWCEASGRGTVYSWSVIRRPQHPGFYEEAPFILGAIRLAEGPMMISRLVQCSPEEVEIGKAVQVVFEPPLAGVAVPKFRLVRD